MGDLGVVTFCSPFFFTSSGIFFLALLIVSFTREQYTTLEKFLTAFYSRYPGGNVFGHNDLDVDEIDPYFDVQDYIEKVFRKTTNQITDPLSESPVDPTDTSVNK